MTKKHSGFLIPGEHAHLTRDHDALCCLFDRSFGDILDTADLGAVVSGQSMVRQCRWEAAMTPLTRITLDPDVMGGKPCIRGMRITVGTIVGLVASGRTVPEILAAYPYLDRADIQEALSYAAWRVEETEVPLAE